MVRHFFAVALCCVLAVAASMVVQGLGSEFLGQNVSFSLPMSSIWAPVIVTIAALAMATALPRKGRLVVLCCLALVAFFAGLLQGDLILGLGLVPAAFLPLAARALFYDGFSSPSPRRVAA